MKKCKLIPHNGLSLIVIFIVLFAPLSLSVAAQGTPHLIYGKVLNSDGVPPGKANLEIYAYIPLRPKELLDESSVGCGYEILIDGWFWLEAGNFLTPWSVNEKIRIIFNDVLRQESGVMDVTLNGSGSQLVSDLYLLPGDHVGPIAYDALVNGKSPISIPEGTASVTLTATIDDSICGNHNIQKAEFFVDADPGLGSGAIMNPTDGSFNSPQEGVTAQVNSSLWKQGSAHIIYVRGRDSINNWGTAHSVVVSVTKPEVTVVAIDIQPGGYPNTINISKKGTIPVAILSSPTFNAPSVVDKKSITFGRTGDENSLSLCNRTPKDVNSDGYPDLICHFDIGKTNFRCGDTWGYLKGKTVDGVRIEGKDSVRILPCK